VNPNPAHTSKDEWLTPPEIISALGEFDLDPCAPIVRPWPTAKTHFTIDDNGLMREWFGRVWMNPPYGRALVTWLAKMSMHCNGVALTFARTDTDAFHESVFPSADSLLFIKRRLTFYNVDGTPGNFNGGAPSVLIGYGEENSDALAQSGISGKHILINRMGIAVVGWDRSWQFVVRLVLIRLNREADLNELYAEVEKMAPEKVEKNNNYKAKIRQIVQQHFRRVKPATYSL